MAAWRAWVSGEHGSWERTVRSPISHCAGVPGRPARRVWDHRGRGQRVSAARVRAREHGDGGALHLLVPVTAVRYLAVRGLADPGLADAVPRVARWREATIPQFPTRLDIDRLLAACDRDEPTRARDYAVLLLLARLGLRAVEVARLRLDDLDWRAGEITVDGKAHRHDQLPLPADVGEAIVAHLKHRGRRSGASHVFLTVHAPVRPLDASGVRTIVRNACRRARVERVASHRLRHALASDLLREGASLIDISQVLRHNQLESTAIYAKVDLARLRLAASPWPGESR
jgi:integrase/recombinase XerD